MTKAQEMVDVYLSRVIIREGAERQYIQLAEESGERGFSIVIGSNEAWEIHRVVNEMNTERPMTHQLTFDAISALDASLKNVDIVDLRQNTFYAQVVLQNTAGDVLAVVDARPSDAIALALRAGCQIRAAAAVIERAGSEPEA